MPTYDHPNLAIHGRFVPDEMTDEERAKRHPDDRPAHAYEIGVEVEGVFIPLYRKRSAQGLLDDIARIKAQHTEQMAASESSLSPLASPSDQSV